MIFGGYPYSIGDKMNRTAIVCIAAVLVVFGFFALTHNNDTTTSDDFTGNFVEEEPIQDSLGKVSASSDLSLYYNNDLSIYGYFLDDVFRGMAYYNDADIDGTIKLNLSKVKWDKNYTPGYSNHVNNVSYAKKHFLKDVKRDYKNDDVTISARLEFTDKHGKSVDLSDLSCYDAKSDKKPMKISLKGDTLTIKVKHKFKTNETPIFNDVPYEGALAEEPSDFDKAYKAKLSVSFENDDYEYTLKSTLKDDNFYIIHT